MNFFSVAYNLSNSFCMGLFK